MKKTLEVDLKTLGKVKLVSYDWLPKDTVYAVDDEGAKMLEEIDRLQEEMKHLKTLGLWE